MQTKLCNGDKGWKNKTYTVGGSINCCSNFGGQFDTI